jgi:hypothetical protein
VIKIGQLTVLSPRISVILEIWGHSKFGNTRPRQWQADTDVREKLRHRRSKSESYVPQDELGHIIVGDPDPTADLGGTTDRSRKCGFEWADQCSRTLILLWSCTRELGHQGPHLAGTGKCVAALHPQ